MVPNIMTGEREDKYPTWGCSSGQET